MRWGHVAALALAVLALGLPAATVQDCNGATSEFTGLQLLWLNPPMGLVPMAVLGFLGWVGLRRQSDAPDVEQLAAAARYTAAAWGGTIYALLPAFAAAGGSAVWRVGGWITLVGWALAALLAGVDGSWPIPAEGADPLPHLRLASMALRWAAVGGCAVIVAACVPFATVDPDTGNNMPLDFVISFGAALVLVALPLFFLLRAFEARARRGAPAAGFFLGLGIALTVVAFGAAVVGTAIDVADRAESARVRAEAAAEEAAERAANPEP